MTAPSSNRALAELRKHFTTAETPELGPGPRAGIAALPELQAELNTALAKTALTPAAQSLVRSLTFLWHDHLDAAHRIAQEIDDADGSYVHGIIHRREPDYGNARYWFRRVGQHPCFAELSNRTAPMLRGKAESDLASKLISGGEWDPYAFIKACEQTAGNSAAASQNQLLRAIQAIEFEILLESFCR